MEIHSEIPETLELVFKDTKITLTDTRVLHDLEKKTINIMGKEVYDKKTQMDY